MCLFGSDRILAEFDWQMTSPAVAIKCTDPAFKGFEMMATRNISSIAVVDENGQIIHNLSTSDVRLFFGTTESEPAQDLESDMEDYLARKQSNASKSKTRAPISVCKEVRVRRCKIFCDYLGLERTT